ncbi:MAG: hypothetical protein AAGD38_17900, partial [Acidobacteriota bacterium]
GVDYEPMILVFRSRALWLMGQPDEAERASRLALESAAVTNHPSSNASTLENHGLLELMRRDDRAAASYVRQCLALSREYGFLHFRLSGEAILVSAESRYAALAAGDHDVVERISAAKHAIDCLQEHGILFFCLPCWATLAEACIAFGRFRDAEEMIDKALAISGPDGVRYWEAELYRLTGALAWARDDSEGARTGYHQALAMAREQGALSLELRAATSLFELEGDADSHALLAEVFGRFTEGFDTPDLKHAAELLA